ncbi:MAG: phage tail assembly chaperone [Notoacmeibacter sp.]|nr:phage tail assembly chaperone [Notoacmeibacter sp.]
MNAAAPAEPFPWTAVLSHAFGVLRLSPDAFWSMTPRELAFALPPALSGQAAPGRSGLECLMQAFPDDVLKDPFDG